MTILVGDNIWVKATIKDRNDVLTDPTAHEIKLFDPDGTQSGSTETSPTKLATGTYEQLLQIPSSGKEGNWTVTWKITLPDGSTDRHYTLVAVGKAPAD